MNSQLPIIIFGDRSFASLAWYCLSHDAKRRVVGFTIDAAYQSKQHHEGLPVVAFERLESVYPPGDHELLIPLSSTRINGLRKERYLQAKQRGYRFTCYISSRASVWPNLQLGENCMIFEHAVVQPFATIGDNVIVRAGANIGHHNVIGSHAFIATEVTFGGNVTLGEQTFVGLGATLRDGIHVAARTLVGAGAVLLADTDADGVYVGNPARRTAKSSLEATDELRD